MKIGGHDVEKQKRSKLRNLVLPGFSGVPIVDVFTFVVRGFGRGTLVTRASSMAFNMLMAVIPSTIFIFTLIPFIPIENFQRELVVLFESVLPSNVYSFLESTIVDVVTRRSGTLLIFMFLATVLFSTNGIHSLIHSFVVSAHDFKARSWIEQRKISIVLLLILHSLIYLAGGLIIFGKFCVESLVDAGLIESGLVYYILIIFKWLLSTVLLFIGISFLYWLAPARRSEFTFISAGSTLATLLFISTSLGFSAYVNNFGQYNKLYGSIGTLMVILIWLYLNSIALLIGFEINLSIRAANGSLKDGLQDVNHNEDTSSPG